MYAMPMTIRLSPSTPRGVALYKHPVAFPHVGDQQSKTISYSH